MDQKLQNQDIKLERQLGAGLSPKQSATVYQSVQPSVPIGTLRSPRSQRHEREVNHLVRGGEQLVAVGEQGVQGGV